jgi:hypothetical protein
LPITGGAAKLLRSFGEKIIMPAGKSSFIIKIEQSRPGITGTGFQPAKDILF